MSALQHVIYGNFPATNRVSRAGSIYFVGLTVILNSDRDTISEICNCGKWLSEVEVYRVHLREGIIKYGVLGCVDV